MVQWVLPTYTKLALPGSLSFQAAGEVADHSVSGDFKALSEIKLRS